MNAVVGLFVKGFHMGGMQSILGGIARALQTAGCRVVFLTSEGEEDDFYAPPAGCGRVVVGQWKDKALRAERRDRQQGGEGERHPKEPGFPQPHPVGGKQIRHARSPPTRFR